MMKPVVMIFILAFSFLRYSDTAPTDETLSSNFFSDDINEDDIIKFLDYMETDEFYPNVEGADMQRNDLTSEVTASPYSDTNPTYEESGTSRPKRKYSDNFASVSSVSDTPPSKKTTITLKKPVVHASHPVEFSQVEQDEDEPVEDDGSGTNMERHYSGNQVTTGAVFSRRQDNPLLGQNRANTELINDSDSLPVHHHVVTSGTFEHNRNYYLEESQKQAELAKRRRDYHSN